ncbi:MAG TPA: hypothetical protein VMF70_04525 [Gemmatimonadales bacterium]|nr:hypothetical protein [Gemmatimonadales bacterium]
MNFAEDTLGGYVAVHGRPPGLTGSDGHPYSVGVFSEDDPGPDGRYGAALLFIRWSASNAPDGHLESDYLAFGPTAAAAEAEVGRLSLLGVKEILDALIASHPGSGAT